jgi:hypothetical protein
MEIWPGWSFEEGQGIQETEHPLIEIPDSRVVANGSTCHKAPGHGPRENTGLPSLK